ncbi:TolC family protein [Salegentibacter salegens]|uniref:Outer membrane protein TolC n=1 Tax=Salegentibacter salegens TaxID=143223 RepID=A0A1M7HLG7_9FLAO|nr:TolC family protein [Salegentibacter salegens]PRX39453.1 outer membrane protein TolC [Salegentibacter salegens]SHM29290.1 Outer membrane protein TolC [Salegentibacter salegens]
MYRYIVSTICGILISIGSFAQSPGVKIILDEISQNNRQLKAYQSYIASKDLGNKTENNLQDPQVSAFYLPFGEHETDDYYEYQVSQRFEFPTVYSARNKRIEKQKELLEFEYKTIRQEVLLIAKKQLLELQILQKRKKLEQERVEQAKQVYEQIQRLFKAEQIGILELNKAKVAWLQEQFEMDQIEMEIKNTFLELQKLNGGNAINEDQLYLMEDNELASMQTLWQEKLSTDAEVQQLNARETLAEQQLKLEKNKILPDLSIGYNYQGVNSSNYSGFLGGLSIPLWNSKNKVKAARANLEYSQANTGAETAELFTQFQEDYQQYQLLKRKFEEYEGTFKDLNSEELLFKAYKLGEFSFLDYYREVEFYRQAYNKKLEMEKELLQLKATLLKHQL